MTLIRLETNYVPSWIDLRKWAKIQEWFVITDFEMKNNSKTGYEYALRRQQLANKIRSNWEVIEGGLDKPVLDIERVGA